MVDGSGKPDERDSSSAQIRTLLEEQGKAIIAEYREKVGHLELQAAQAEEERRLLREELWRQKLEFREAHQRSLTEMEELRKFQSSFFDTIARRKLIEDQNTILELYCIREDSPQGVWCTQSPPFCFYLSFLPFSVFFLYPELFLELDNPIVMASLRYSAAEESEDTLNSSTSHTGYEPNLLTFGVATWKTKESGFSLNDKKSKFSLKSELRSRSTKF